MLQDLRYALRTLLRTRGLATAALVAFALGIGANTAVFSVVEAVLLRSLPFPEAERMVDVKSSRGTSSFQEYEAWLNAPGVFDDAAAAVAEQPVLHLGQGAERVATWIVTANFFRLLGARPLIGRAFVAEDDLPGSAPVAVLSYGFWRKRFSGDREVLGRPLTLDTASYTIVGVLQPDVVNPVGFKHRGDPDVWLALGSFRSGPGAGQWMSRPGFWVIGRLRPGVTPAQAARVLDAAARQRGVTSPDETERGPVVTALHEYLVVQVRTALLVMLAAVSLVVLVACANVTNLLLCRSVAREHEMALRVALGASRPQLLRQVLTESVLLALAGGGLGVLLAFLTVPALVRLAAGELPGIAEIGVNVRVLAGALATSIAAGILAGLAPALRAARQAPGGALRALSATSLGRGWRRRGSDFFIVAQVALTMVLLSGAGLLARSFVRLVQSDPGFEQDHLLTIALQLPERRYSTKRAILAFAQQALERVRALPGVTAAAVGTGMPLEGYAVGPVSLPGRGDERGRPLAWISAVTPDYFRTLRVPLKRGELFHNGGADASEGVIIDEAAAHAYFQGQDALGKQITFYGNRTRTIIGIVADTRERPHEPPPPHVYQPLVGDAATWLRILVRTARDPAESVQIVQHAVRSVDATVPIDRVAPMSELVSDAVARQRFYAVLVTIFAILALLLAASGVFGLTAYAVTHRMREIGVRMALGADRRAVLELILSRGLAVAAAGLGLGIPAALVATQVLKTFLFEIGPRDPVALASMAMLLFVTVLVACYLPGRRATKVDPLAALRYE